MVFLSKVEDNYVEDAHDDEGDVANGDDYVFCTDGNVGAQQYA